MPWVPPPSLGKLVIVAVSWRCLSGDARDWDRDAMVSRDD